MGGKIIATKLNKEEYEAWKELKRVLKESGMIKKGTDYEALKFAINFLASCIVSAQAGEINASK